MKKKTYKIKPFLVLIDGAMGSGKTTVASLLHKKLQNTALVSLSDVKKFISGFEKDHVYNVISQKVILAMAKEYLRNGISVISEWAMSRKRVESFKKLAKKQNARYLVYQLDAPKSLLVKRVQKRTKKLLNKLTKNNIKNMEKNFEKNYSFRADNRYLNAVIIDSNKLNANQVANLILKDIK